MFMLFLFSEIFYATTYVFSRLFLERIPRLKTNVEILTFLLLRELACYSLRLRGSSTLQASFPLQLHFDIRTSLEQKAHNQ